jgi:hypothetical protein
MSASYIGYGLDTQSISSEGLLGLFLKHDDEDRISDMIFDTIGEQKERDDLTEDDRKKLTDAVREWIEEDSETVADYVADTINYGEREAHRMYRQDVVAAYDSFVVFESVMFPGDGEERLRRIRTKQDFISMVRDYIPEDDLCFGPVYDGPEFSDSDFWMEEDNEP